MKRRFAAVTLITICATHGASAATDTTSLEVVVHNVQADRGNVIVSLCGEAAFLKKCEQQAVIPATKGKVVLKFDSVPTGRYAISAYHDENGNQKLDRNAFGIPIEGYGFSRDARGNFGPPKFEDAAFNVTAGANFHELTLSY